MIAIAAGVCDGLGFGDNTKGALLTRGLAEIARLGVALGGRRETFFGLAGMGDLIATAMSRHSRNRRVGERLGRGETLEQVLGAMVMVAEGVHTARAARRSRPTRHGVELPITEQVCAMLFEGRSPREALAGADDARSQERGVNGGRGGDARCHRSRREPDLEAKLYRSISEVSELVGVKPHVLRYWETQFSMLRPRKNRAGNRMYRPGRDQAPAAHQGAALRRGASPSPARGAGCSTSARRSAAGRARVRRRREASWCSTR